MITQVINSKGPETLSIEFMLGNLCNYKCSYCFPGSNTGDYPWPDVDLLIKNLDHLIERYKSYGKSKFEFYLAGGEPTLWKDLPKLCKHLKNNHNVIIRISTNATRKIDWWIKNSQCFDEIEISVHTEYADIPHIVEIADMLYKQRVNVSANVLMNPYRFEEGQSAILELKKSKHRWPINAKAVNYSGETRYNELQKSYMANPVKRWPNLIWWFLLKHHDYRKIWVIDNGRKIRVKDNWFVLNNMNRFKGWNCNLGVDHIEIDKSGQISGTCKEKIYNSIWYHNIYDTQFIDKFNPTIGPIKCGKELCQCGAEMAIAKIIPIIEI